MRIVADESVDKPLVDALRNAGHQIFYILEDNPGIEDKKVLLIANKKKSVLLTAHKDFWELIFRQKYLSTENILLRLKGLGISEKIALILSAFERYLGNFENQFTVITNSHIQFIKLRNLK